MYLVELLTLEIHTLQVLFIIFYSGILNKNKEIMAAGTDTVASSTIQLGYLGR